jgi:hypothetical protein
MHSTGVFLLPLSSLAAQSKIRQTNFHASSAVDWTGSIPFHFLLMLFLLICFDLFFQKGVKFITALKAECKLVLLPLGNWLEIPKKWLDFALRKD